MIPKIIHFCWLSDEEYPDNIKKCMDSWKKHMPDYEIKRWSTANFDISSIPLVQEAFNAKKWAFAADYIRAYALYTDGGVYLDSDVMIYKDLTPLFDSKYISAVEHHPSILDYKKNKKLIDSQTYLRKTKSLKVNGIGIQAAVQASTPQHPFVNKCIQFYNKQTLEQILSERLTAPTVLAINAEEYGFKYQNREQKLKESIHLYKTNIISNFDQKNKKSYAVHMCAGSWLNQKPHKAFISIIKKTYLFKTINWIASKI